MAADKIAVQLNLLERDIKGIQGELRGVRTDIQQLYRQVQELDAMWEGDANAAFVNQFNTDHRLMNELCDFIEEFVARLEFAATSYIKCENEVGDIVSAIQI